MSSAAVGETGIHADDLAYVTSLTRDADRTRYFATLFAPHAARPDLFALYGFAAEIARVPDQVREASLGEIRLQWWRDALEGQGREGEALGLSPALRAIGSLMDRHSLPLAAFTAMIDARRSDLYANPPESIADLEGYLGQTESSLVQIAAIVLGSEGPETAEAAGHAGIAFGLARRLARFAADRSSGRTILVAPTLEREGLSPAEVYAGRSAKAVHRAIGSAVLLARDHLHKAQQHLRGVPEKPRRAFLPLAITQPLLDRIERRGEGIVDDTVEMSDLAILLRLAAARIGRHYG